MALVMHMTRPPRSPMPTRAWRELVTTCAELAFEPHDIAAQLDARGRYEVPLDDEFALAIKLFHYSSREHTRGATWHERLELFIPLDGRTLFRMGDETVELAAGDLLVVENLTLHHVVDFPGFDTRVIVVSFRPEFVYSLGSPSYDYTFLVPFFARAERRGRVMSLQNEPDACHAVRRLIECRFAAVDTPVQRAGCKAFLLQLLFELGRRFPASEQQHFDFIRQQQRSMRLKAVFDHVREHFADRLTVAQAAHMVGMSAPQFMKTFKKVAGMTLVAYVNHVRLATGARLLRETGLTIAEIATEVGFSDQSYFDKRFKRAFGRTPKAFRLGLRGENPPNN
jgi:AraC family transcriptional regulator, transcriptional activator of pobA